MRLFLFVKRQKKSRYLHSDFRIFSFVLVEVKGFEPSTSASRTLRANQAALHLDITAYYIFFKAYVNMQALFYWLEALVLKILMIVHA